MAFSGIIDQTSPITLARLLERIYDADEPGELILEHHETKEKAVLVINRGEVVNSQCGELSGDAAMKQLCSTFPWSYHFVGRNNSAAAGDEQLPMPRPAKRPALKLKPLLASEERPAFHSSMPTMAPGLGGEDQVPPSRPVRKPVMLARKPVETALPEAEAKVETSSPTTPELSVVQDRPVLRMLEEAVAEVALPEDSAPQPEFPPTAPALSQAKIRYALALTNLSAWLAGGDDHFLRFAESEATWHGPIDPSDWDYFRADHQWLAAVAKDIGQCIGFSQAVTMAVAEPQRAAGYGSLETGFVGILGGKGAGVVQVLQFNEPLPA